ncbi:hypothetical protein Tco_0388838 [Tanacetum coccineum]
MDDLVQDFFIRPEGNTFDLDVYESYTNLFTIKCHYYGKFNDGPKKEYIEGETCFVDLVNRDQFTDVVLNTVINSLGYEMEDEVLYWYKIPLKSLDVGLKPLVSESDYRRFLGYVEKHKVMDVYVEIVEKNEESESGSDSASESDNDFKDEEHVVQEVEVNMGDFNFQVENGNMIPVAPKVNLTEDNIEVLDFDSLESDLEDVPENDRRDVAKDLIRTHAVESRRNLHFLRNDPIRIRVVCNGVVPCKNLVTYKVPGPNVDNAVKGKIVNEDAEEDKITCPWLLYLSKGDKGKWFIKTFKDEHHCLQSRKIKYCTSTFLSKHITDLIIMNPNMPIKAIQEQMQKKFHVAVSRDMNVHLFKPKEAIWSHEQPVPIDWTGLIKPLGFTDLLVFVVASLPMHSIYTPRHSGMSMLFVVSLQMLMLFQYRLEICLDSGCSKHLTGNHTLLTNFMEKFLGMVRFGNDDFAVIAGYGDAVLGSMTIKKVYYIKGLGHNLLSIGQFCNKGLEVAFRKFTCFVRTVEGVDLLTGDRSSNLYVIALKDIASNSSVCLLAKASSS